MALSDLRVIQRDPTTGKISWSMTKHPQTISGIDKLVQTFALAILNDAGRDALDPNKGGGLLSLIGQYNYDETSLSVIMDDIYRMLEKAASEVRRDQAGLLNEDPNAMLNVYRVVDFSSDDAGNVALKLRVVSMAGTTADITV
jgi:hypothetical protein